MENRITIDIKPKTTIKSRCSSSSLISVGNYRYNTSDQIGLGYVSNVYKGHHAHTNQIVAIKVIDMANLDQITLSLLQCEIKVLQKIKSYYCKRLLLLQDNFKLNNRLYIVTEFCEGNNISKILRKRKVFNQIEAQTIMKQLLLAYQEVYELGLVHRDLKLSNLLIKGNQLKLADFGFSAQIIDCIDQFSYNAGSPLYMPPQSLQRNRFSFKSDIWALGVIAYQLIFGDLPYREKVDSLLFQKITNSKIEDLLINKIDMSNEYKQFIIKCMDKDMQKRATPQFVINYLWPLAKPNLDGIIECPISRTIPFTQNISNISRLPPPPPTPSTKIHQQIPPLSIIQNIHPIVRLQQIPQPQKMYLTPNKKAHQITFQINTQRPSTKCKEIQFSTAQTIQEEQSNKKIEKIDNELSNKEQALEYQINYCNFLFDLYILLEEESFLPKNSQLREEISHKILNNYSEMSKSLLGEQNQFVKLGQNINKNQKFEQIEADIEAKHYFFKYKFSSKLNTNSFQSLALINSIDYLSKNIEKNWRLIQYLCIYYSLKQVQKTQKFYSLFSSLSTNLPLQNSRLFPQKKQELELKVVTILNNKTLF